MKLTAVSKGQTVLDVLRAAGFYPDAPCGGHGSCGKCKVLINGKEHLACQTPAAEGMIVTLPEKQSVPVLTVGNSPSVQPDSDHPFVLAFDIGTTSIVSYLLSGSDGHLLAEASMLNPQTAFGADVISRIQHALNGGASELKACISTALSALTQEAAHKAGIKATDITLAVIVGNPAMHHLFLGIDPKSLTIPPYMPKITEALELPAENLLPIAKAGTIRILPNIAGFVGADTVSCLVATHFDELKEITLLIDIGTNGEMILGNREHYLACSTAAGPAFEGAKISCGMRGVSGAISHVQIENGALHLETIGGLSPKGLCGSGLLDLVAALLDMNIIDSSGRLLCGTEYRIPGTEVVLTQKDIREVQLAKAAIRTGIELMAEKLQLSLHHIQTVYLAGAFGNYLNPVSACRIGMIPPILSGKIQGIGNAAGEGAKLCALSKNEFTRSQKLAQNAEFLELAMLPQFQKRYVSAMTFSEEEEEEAYD